MFSDFDPIGLTSSFLASYGWYLLGAALVGLYAWTKIKPILQAWKEAREDAAYHKDPDKVMARMEAIQRARELQQQRLLAESERAKELQAQREEKKRAENLQNLEKYVSPEARDSSSRLDDSMPLSRGGGVSTYRPRSLKRSCPGGGCG